jgi:hypothetical protein
MKQRFATVLAVCLCAVPILGAQTSEKTIQVFVTAVPVEKADKEMQKQQEIDVAEASKGLKALDKKLQAEHGNTRANWPAASQDLYWNAQDLVRIATMRRDYGKQDQSHVVDSIEDSRKGFSGAGMRSKRENVILVDSADAAQVIVELRGRRTAPGVGLFGQQFIVLAAIKPGPKLGAAQFAAIPRAERTEEFVRGPQPDAPEWLFEAVGTGSWKSAGTVVSNRVAKFLSDNYDVLTKTAANAIQ